MPFTEDQRDCLQEISNVAMGAAGEALAAFSKVFVELSIPVIRSITPEQLPSALVSLQGADNTSGKVSGVVQQYRIGDFNGLALVAITDTSFLDLANQRGVEIATDADSEKLLAELSETITQVCLPMLAEQFEASDVEIEAPVVASLHVSLDDFRIEQVAQWEQITTVEINYHLEGHPFNCDLLLVVPGAYNEALVAKLDELLA